MLQNNNNLTEDIHFSKITVKDDDLFHVCTNILNRATDDNLFSLVGRYTYSYRYLHSAYL